MVENNSIRKTVFTVMLSALNQQQLLYQKLRRSIIAVYVNRIPFDDVTAVGLPLAPRCDAVASKQSRRETNKPDRQRSALTVDKNQQGVTNKEVTMKTGEQRLDISNTHKREIFRRLRVVMMI